METPGISTCNGNCRLLKIETPNRNKEGKAMNLRGPLKRWEGKREGKRWAKQIFEEKKKSDSRDGKGHAIQWNAVNLKDEMHHEVVRGKVPEDWNSFWTIFIHRWKRRLKIVWFHREDEKTIQSSKKLRILAWIGSTLCERNAAILVFVLSKFMLNRFFLKKT